MKADEIEFLKESNAIESVYDDEALEDAIKAWKYIKSRHTLSFETVIETHRRLMQRKNIRIAGCLRKVNVYVGGWKAPNPGQVRRLLLTWSFDIALIHPSHPDAIDPATWAKMVHISFEKIHPFEDGNGRVGRILYNWHRLQLDLPLHIIHTGPEQWEYYQWFK